MNLHFSTGKLLSVCVCCSLLGGRAVGCIMQEAGDEPSQEGGCVEMRHSMTCFRRACIIQHRPSNSLSCLSHCRVFTVEKSDCFPPGNQSNSVLLQLPHSCPKILPQSHQLIQKAASCLVFCLPRFSHVTQFS